jgi:uncharacterized membrane protein (UPF0127 family)
MLFTLVISLMVWMVPVHTSQIVGDCSQSAFAEYSGRKQQLTVARMSYTVALAVTPSEMARGLGGVQCLNPTDAMLFVYEIPTVSSFWMKDMLIAIDMIWLNENGEIITIAHNVSPDTYPKSFSPDAPAQYVMEVRADAARMHNWDVGTKLFSPDDVRLAETAHR